MLIQGKHVGDVIVRGVKSSWGYGRFTPSRAFSEFAPLFGTWSLLMHADEQSPVLSDAASEELRDLEYKIDHLKVELHWVEEDVRLRVSQLNIDGDLIEWKRG